MYADLKAGNLNVTEPKTDTFAGTKIELFFGSGTIFHCIGFILLSMKYFSVKSEILERVNYVTFVLII
jgi:hypothetical protein